MPITFKCTRCKAELTVKDELAGKPGKCPSCKEVLTVPASRGADTDEQSGRPSSSRVQTTGIAKKQGRDEEEITDLEEVEEDEEESPRKKNTRTKAGKAREEEDEEEAPRKSRKKSTRHDEDEDEEDDRPARKKIQGKRRRDEEDEEEDDPKAGKKRKPALRFAALGVFLHCIGSFIYAGVFFLAGVGMMIYTGSIASDIRKGERETEPPRMTEAQIKAAIKEAEEKQKKRKKLVEWTGLDKPGTKSAAVFKAEQRILAGAQVWAGLANGMVVVIGFLIGFLLLAAYILIILGLVFTLWTPGNAAVLSFSIAGLAWTAGLGLICFTVIFIILLGGDGGLCLLVPFFMHNLFSGANPAAVTNLMAGWIVPAVGFVFYLVPVLELGRMVMFTLYQWFVGKSQRDRASRGKGFLMLILIPSIVLGLALLILLISMALPTEESIQVKQNEAFQKGKAYSPSPWPDGLILTFGVFVLGGLFLWSAVTNFSTRNALRYGK